MNRGLLGVWCVRYTCFKELWLSEAVIYCLQVSEACVMVCILIWKWLFNKILIMLNAVLFYRISRWCYLHHIPMIPQLVTLFIFLVYNSKIPYKAKIGKGTFFG